MENQNRIIGEYRFESEAEYQAACRDLAKINAIEKQLDLNIPENVIALYGQLQTGQFKFETKVGRDFDDRIYETFLQLKTDTGLHDKRNVKKAKELKEQITAEKKNESDQTPQKTVKGRRILILIASIVGGTCLLYFTVYCIMSWMNQQKQQEMAGRITDDNLPKIFYDKSKDNNTSKEGVIQETPPEVLEKYLNLYNDNKKLIGWLKIDDTIIDYPVLQTTDNEYYLTHGYHQEYDKNGSLFLDYECSIYPRSANLIIYGHHMKSGNMFGTLDDYEDEKYWKKHPVISFDTIYEENSYEVMFVFRSKVYSEEDISFKYYQFIEPNSEAEFNTAMEEMAKMALYDTGISAVYGDQLLTLSTCDYTQTGGRFVVVAKKMIE